MKKHFVTFLSPGTFFSEQSERPVKSWDVDAAKGMAASIKERHNAIPYGFYFTTRERKDNELDSREVKRSGMYYLGGIVETLSEIEKRGDPKEKTLLSNMRSNKWNKVITNNNSWKVTQPLLESDIVLDWP